MIPELQLYRYAFYVLVAATVGFLVWVSRMPTGKRRYYLPVPIICGTLALGYFGMSAELLTATAANGQPMPMSRYVDYFITTPVMIAIAGLVAGASRRQQVAMFVFGLGWIGATVVGYFLEPPLDSVSTLVTLASLVVLIYLMVGPVTKRSGKQGGERVLLYGKLRNLLILIWVFYLVLGIASRQNLGLLDAFSGVFLGVYIDVLTRVGFGVLVLRATDATDQVIEQLQSSGSGDDGSGGVTLEKSDDPAVDPAD
ncbi:bacteriorhodopsin [Natrinema sp. 1APR25-10V2]|uniref:bacteriorhodopsin n=1 Tax=Natrinema sp. 1APR25-10V2 TaxID=2951081 RepID=UPI0028746CF9|nr:bacteriorhodopsin [Natrinema sp. 1APR25-10V2]MDS0476380.1 bacteriorhodopsin [Natrinema sp. 1APR25-10V2]